MANRKFWFVGILIIVLAFGMMVWGCKDGSSDDDGGREEIITLPSTSGEFIFTDIPPQYNGKFALLDSSLENISSKYILGFNGATRNTSNPGYVSTMTGVKIENESVKIPLYTVLSSSSPVSTIQAYTGSDTAYVAILIYDTEVISAVNLHNYNAAAVFGTASDDTPTSFPVQFTNGKASKSNNNADEKLSN